VDGGAGVFVHDGASVLIADSLFTNNTASGSKSTGGGLDCRTAGSVLTVTNCTFAGNSACLGGGLDAVGDVEVSCVDCKFLGNTAKGHGGGLRLATTAKVRIDGCVFDGNNTTDEKYDGEADNAGGGGVFVQTQSGDGFVGISNSVFRDNITKSRGGGFGHTWKASVYGEVVNCRFIGNSSYRQGGGMVLREEAPRADRPFLIRNCLFAFNTSTCTSSSLDCSGAGLHFVSYGNPILDSCTIVANNSGQSKCSGGIHHRWGGTVTNCIVAFNTKAGTAETGTGWCLVDPNNTSVLVPSAYVNSCAWPAAEGAFLAANGCLNANPQFRDAAHGDFTLKAASPCRDAGVSESWMTGAVDLAGRQRVRGRYVDMGAYEYFPCGCLFMFW
ncbi:MAG: hypothetical protein IJQ65_06145, partial [Kiritimatiellae bacterium]|nr:hypothetical protein [Kiritimatiellia bacterium]